MVTPKKLLLPVSFFSLPRVDVPTDRSGLGVSCPSKLKKKREKNKLEKSDEQVSGSSKGIVKRKLLAFKGCMVNQGVVINSLCRSMM